MDSRVSMEQITGWSSDDRGGLMGFDRVAWVTPSGWGRTTIATRLDGRIRVVTHDAWGNEVRS